MKAQKINRTPEIFARRSVLEDGHGEKRLTIRPPEKLESLIRKEAVKRGTNMNQTMLYMLNRLIDLV